MSNLIVLWYFLYTYYTDLFLVNLCARMLYTPITCNRAREIIGFAGSGPIFETENRFISQQEAKKSVHKTLYFSRFCNTQTDIVTCQNCSHLIRGWSGGAG